MKTICDVEYLTVREAAEKLGLTEFSVTRLIRLNKLQAVKSGCRWYILPSSLQGYLLAPAARGEK